MHTRAVERAALRRKLEAGANIHMPAPRRIGKTWTIGRLAEDLRAAGWTVVELDVQGKSVPDDFVRSLCEAIQKQLSSRATFVAAIKRRLSNVVQGKVGDDPLDVLLHLSPTDFLESLIAALEEERDRSAIFIDEIAYFLLKLAERDREAANEFFYRLRAIQLAHKKVKWLLTGSIGLGVVASRFGLEGAFVDLETFVLAPFNKDEARSFVRDPTMQATFTHQFSATDEVLDEVFDELGWLAPWYLRLIANEVRPSKAKGSGPLHADKEDFDQALSALLQPNRRSEFAVWREHIDKNLLKADRDLARRVLDRLCRTAEGEKLDTLISSDPTVERRALRDVVTILECDGLLCRVGDRFRFRSGLIRRYWLEYETE